MRLLLLLILILAPSAHATEIMAIDFDLAEVDCLKGSPTEGELDELIRTVQGPELWRTYAARDGSDDPRLKDAFIIIPVDKEDFDSPEVMRTMGMTAKEALLHSRDMFQESGCAAGHDQGDMANRWCHSAIARTFSSWLETKGASPVVASIAGGLFWAPKEFFYDMNPSAHDFAFTYVDRLGTESTTFEVTVFGDAFFKKYFGKDFALFKESTPFITVRRKF